MTYKELFEWAKKLPIPAGCENDFILVGSTYLHIYQFAKLGYMLSELEYSGALEMCSGDLPKPIALWNSANGEWQEGSVGVFSVSSKTQGITLKDAGGAALTNCAAGQPDVFIEFFVDGISDGIASYQIGDNSNTPLSTTGNAATLVSYFNSAPIQDGSILAFNKEAFALNFGYYGKDGTNAKKVSFSLWAKDCLGQLSAISTTTIDKYKIIGGDNALMADFNGNIIGGFSIGGLYDYDNVALLGINAMCDANIWGYSSPFVGIADDTQWFVRDYTLGGILNNTPRLPYSSVEPRYELAPELTSIDGFFWSFDQPTIINNLYTQCVDRFGGYYYSQPIPVGETNILSNFSVGNLSVSSTDALHYNIGTLVVF